jgi:predicted O-methyltransferase YrrM
VGRARGEGPAFSVVREARGPVWERVIRSVLPSLRRNLPPASSILEVGYGNGLLSCFMCRELGWNVLGLDVRSEAKAQAEANAERFALKDKAKFLLVDPSETRCRTGSYDGVFIMTVLYSSRDLAEYSAWLDWIGSVLKPGGILINFESGRANGLMQAYRRLRRREYKDLCLYTSEVETLYDERFEILERRHFAGWSQFLAPIPRLHGLAAKIEETLAPRHADNCFVASIIARRPIGGGATRFRKDGVPSP